MTDSGVAGGEPTRPSLPVEVAIGAWAAREHAWVHDRCYCGWTGPKALWDGHRLLAAQARVVAAVEALHRASPPDRPLSPLSEDFRLGYNAALDKAVRAARGATGGKT